MFGRRASKGRGVAPARENGGDLTDPAGADGTAPPGGSRQRKEPDPAPPPAEAPVRRGPGRFVRALVALAAFAGMVAFAVVLARLTLEASPASVSLTHDNLTPGRSIEAYLGRPAFVDTVKQLGGNILLGVPFGILLPLLSRRARGFVRVALLTAATMLLVELVQGALVTGRAFDIDDVLLNTTGALLGYALVGRRLGRAVHPRTRPRWWHRRRPARTPAEDPGARPSA
ncbi:VanZ family protein [Streptomyces roseolus]|uniref:VanZ family protein n=1 Tax=Streptomyces roseolus TaxID=67358 RepID=UPI00370028D1